MQDAASIIQELMHLDALPLVIESLALEMSPRQGGENNEHARALAESEERLPPIVVHGPSMRVIDGIHRVRAAIIRGKNDSWPSVSRDRRKGLGACGGHEHCPRAAPDPSQSDCDGSTDYPFLSTVVRPDDLHGRRAVCGDRRQGLPTWPQSCAPRPHRLTLAL
jgi:hypothetical protein